MKIRTRRLLSSAAAGLVLAAAPLASAQQVAPGAEADRDSNATLNARNREADGDRAAMAEATRDLSTSKYVMMAGVGDMFEIESSRLAQTQARSEEVKRFAQILVQDHTRTSQQLLHLMSAEGTAPQPPQLDEAHRAKLERLRQAQGAEFDSLYVQQQIEAHETALMLHQAYAENGDDPRLKAFAQTTAQAVQQHLLMAQQMAGGAGAASAGEGTEEPAEGDADEATGGTTGSNRGAAGSSGGAGANGSTDGSSGTTTPDSGGNSGGDSGRAATNGR